MSHIKSRKHPTPTRTSTLAAAGLVTGLSLAALPGLAHAEAPASARTLDKVEVHAQQGYKREKSASPKFTQNLQDTPQTMQVIASELFNQQGATSLTEALRNTAGVGTFYAGENGNTSTGDAVYMRGFDTSSSIFIDGVRDLGSITRDVFNTEQVEVVKGPAGTDNGRSAPTGAINMVSKQANLRNAVSGTVSAGVDGQKRATADWNQTLGETSALRINALWQDSDVAGRDHVNNQRQGLAASLGFGLGSDTRYYLNLLHVTQDNVPDGFVPTIGLPGWTPQPGLEQLAGHPVNPSNFYGTRQDHDEVTAQQATFRFEHDFSDALKLSNTLRWGKAEQEYLLTAFMSTGGNATNPLAGNIKWTNINDLSTYTLARSTTTTKDQENSILTDQLNLRGDFATGSVQHNLSTGLEWASEKQDTRSYAATGARPPANLYNPNWNDADNLVIAHNGASTHGKTDTTSLYLFDTLNFGESFLLTAGLRADHYTTDYRTVAATGVATAFSDSDTLFNWKLGAIYKPNESVSLYANYALSQQPPGGSNFQLNESPNSANSINLDPQEARTIEAGTKWSFRDDALALNLTVFRTEVTNEITGNATDGYYQNGQKTVEGVEISTVGRISDNWSVSAGYTHQKTQVHKGTLLTADGSNNLTYTPEDAFTGWTTYSFPFGLVLGGGVRYSGEMHRGTDGAKGTPAFTKSYTVYDAVASYAVNEHLMLRLNAYNLFDKQYVASINKSGYRYTPGTPRTFVFSADFRF